jgi:hypothetical protein
MNTELGSHESRNPLLRSMRSTVGRESTTFGFSILVTVTFAVVQATQGSPKVSHIFAYAIGAVMSFTILEGLLSRGFQRPMPQHATQTLNLGTSLNVVSVVAGLAAGWGVSEGTRGLVAWAGAPLVAGLVYLLLESLEEAAAEHVLVASGDTDAAKVSNQDS